MTTHDRICALEERRLTLLQLDWRDAHQQAELQSIAAELEALWRRRRCEKSRATMEEPADFRANRAGLASIDTRLKTPLRKEVRMS